VVTLDIHVSEARWILYTTVAVSVFTSIFAAFLVYKINGIVHGELYSYGLQFNLGWASSYWAIERLIYACLTFSAAFAGFAVFADIWSNHRHASADNTGQKVRDKSKFEITRENSILISCPKCKKVFSRPLTILSSEGGRSKLVNVCPYCNNVLGENDDDSNIRVLRPKEQITH
jgi:hypothetical protein